MQKANLCYSVDFIIYPREGMIIFVAENGHSVLSADHDSGSSRIEQTVRNFDKVKYCKNDTRPF